LNNEATPIISRRSISVGAGIFLTRVANLIRGRVFARYFGISEAADVFQIVLQIPVFFQSLFGEGALSASFIPVYAQLVARDDSEGSRRVAWSIGSTLALFVSVAVAAGTLGASEVIRLVAPGFTHEKRELAVRIAHFLFPAAGLIALSAWCLGILNAHRRFFLAYSAPVLWNLAILATLIGFGKTHVPERLAIDVAVGLCVGSALQFLLLLPFSLRIVRAYRKARPEEALPIRRIRRGFFPGMLVRGVIHLVALCDGVLATFLPTGAVAAVAYAQAIYLLPTGLFGFAVIPDGEDEAARARLRHRIETGLSRISFYAIPAVAAFLFLGDTIASAIYQSGTFDRNAALLVWGILAAGTVGILPAIRVRLISSALVAMGDAKIPVAGALSRVFLGGVLGYFGATWLPGRLDCAQIYGSVFITSASALVAWLEYFVLKNRLEVRIGEIRPGERARNRAVSAAVIASGMAFSLKITIEDFSRPIFSAVIVLSAFAAIYFTVGALLGIEESKRICARFGLRFG
jgi:putative peptidoglycan lipid II flippase